MRSNTWLAEGCATLFCVALWLTGCATVVDHRVEQLIAAELPRVIGAAARYDVNVDGARETAEIIDIRRVRIVGAKVERAGSPVLERLDVTMTDLVVDRNEKRLRSLGTADASALLLPTDVAAFLDKRPGLDNVQVTLFPPYEISIETQFALGGFALPRSTGVRIRGRLLANDARLILEIIDLRVAGFPVGTIPSIVAEKLINPLVDLSAMPGKARVTSVQILPDAVLLTASSNFTPIGRALTAINTRMTPVSTTAVSPISRCYCPQAVGGDLCCHVPQVGL